jgi:hypothetical protein
MVRLSLILAGEHIVKIVAATTKGLETSRTCKLVVLPAEGDANVTVSAADMANVPVGATVHVYYQMADMPDGYHALRITTPWWGDNAEDQIVAQFDLTADTANPYDFTYTEANKAIVDERGGMLLVGYGYKLTKITFSK